MNMSDDNLSIRIILACAEADEIFRIKGWN